MSEDVEETEAVDAASDGDGDRAGEPVEGAEMSERERVEAAEPEQLADELAALRERVEEAEAALADREAEIDDLESRLKRERADFQNYKKRMEERREQDRRRAAAELLERVLDVRDNLERALDQEDDVDVRDGVETTLRQFDRVLADQDVDRIEPDRGEPIDPERHEVLTTVDSDEPGGTVVDRYRPGYELGDRVIRPAQVTVSEGGEAEASGDEPEADDDDVSSEDQGEPAGTAPRGTNGDRADSSGGTRAERGADEEA